MFEMLRDLVGRVKVEIDNEKKERYYYELKCTREASEETILSLIEDACGKLATLQM
jgi:hypothetical protein